MCCTCLEEGGRMRRRAAFEDVINVGKSSWRSSVRLLLAGKAHPLLEDFGGRVKNYLNFCWIIIKLLKDESNWIGFFYYFDEISPSFFFIVVVFFFLWSKIIVCATVCLSSEAPVGPNEISITDGNGHDGKVFKFLFSNLYIHKNCSRSKTSWMYS